MRNLLDYIFFMRPALFPPVWTILILGARASDVREGGSPIASLGFSAIPSDLAILLVLSTFLYGGVYTLNQAFDVESDRANKKLFFLAEGLISVRSAVVFTMILDLIAVVGAFLLGFRVGVLFLFIVMLGILYSHPRTNFKGKPSHGYWSNAIGHGVIPFMIGWTVFDAVSLEAALKSIPYMLGVGAIYLNTTLPDREGDRTSGKITHGVRWGVRKTMQSSVFLVVLSIITAQMAGDFAFLICAVIALPFFVIAAVANGSDQMQKIVFSTKIAILALSLFACIYLPYYLAILVPGFAVSRIYYRSRFGINYPSLS